MSTRRVPKVSRLSGMNPVTSQVSPPLSVAKRDEHLSENQVRLVSKVKVTFQLDPIVAGKVRGAFRLDGPQRGVLSLSAWVEEILQASLDEFEAIHGEVELVPPGQVPSGKSAR